MRCPSFCRRRLTVSVALAQLAAASVASAQAEDEPLEPRRTEPGLLAAIDYDSDLGFGLGAVASVARFHEGYDPYR